MKEWGILRANLRLQRNLLLRHQRVLQKINPQQEPRIQLLIKAQKTIHISEIPRKRSKRNQEHRIRQQNIRRALKTTVAGKVSPERPDIRETRMVIQTPTTIM